MAPVLMRTLTDCETAALATATGESYEKTIRALGYKDLPGSLENPIFGNPLNLYRALINLGYWKRNITLSDLLKGNAKPGKTVVLLHDPKNPNANQHWAVFAGKKIDFFLFFWGDKPEPRGMTQSQLIDRYRKGFPNCAFEVYKASFWRVWLEKLKRWFK
jgi:hypothetical protein